ncbi:MAG: phytanoyl-CoA dioxygenase family protein [Cyanobacteriota bacterium]|nr:phytanoyl-CoA dioxygenase family protein [Cyanobacteriota bacterium]
MGQAIGAHYDRIYLRGSNDQFVTAWIPLGDVPIGMGGITYLEGSQHWGEQLEQGHRRSHAQLPQHQRVHPVFEHQQDGGWISRDLAQLGERLRSRGLVANFQAGDVVLHSPYMIHASTNNDDQEGRIRLSTDLRFQRANTAIDQRWNQHWSMGDGL